MTGASAAVVGAKSSTGIGRKGGLAVTVSISATLVRRQSRGRVGSTSNRNPASEPQPQGDTTMRFTTRREIARTKAGMLLWTIQGVLALLFLFAGSMKLAVPADALAKM